MLMSSKGIQIFDENSLSQRDIKVVKKIKRTALQQVDPNIVKTLVNVGDIKRTPKKTHRRETRKTLSPGDFVPPQTDNVPEDSPLRALNESLFEVVAESPRDIKIRELSRTVQVLQADARALRDIYAEELETLRDELHNRPQVPQEAIAPTCVQNESTCENSRVSAASSIISEAESIIAMAEAMLSCKSSFPHQSALPLPFIPTVSDESASLRAEIETLKKQRERDQRRFEEMEVVMKAMAAKLEENSKLGSDENWVGKIISLFST